MIKFLNDYYNGNINKIRIEQIIKLLTGFRVHCRSLQKNNNYLTRKNFEC